jgi:uracil-DNA glycosylase
MQPTQWKIASAQLLSHWRRCGISQVPTTSPARLSEAEEWIQAQSSAIFELPPTPSGTMQYSAPPAAKSSLAPVAPAASTAAGAPPRVRLDQGSGTVGPMQLKPVQAPLQTHQGSWLTQPQNLVSRQTAFQSLNDQVVACRKCEEIVCRRQRTVFGVGPVDARIVMFGEAPGADEDRMGEPFVGAAGQLLDKILVASGLKRDEVYIMNSLKCRPPNNRTPSDSEIENCRPFFESQLETIQPDFIVCWGAIAVRAVLKSTESVGRLRGRFHNFRGAKVLVTYHPAYLLRNPDAKRLTWDDMKMLMREIGIPVPGKG